jgi:histidinol-phosphate aminotransferase
VQANAAARRPAPRPTGSDFSPYLWAAVPAEIAARHGLAPAHVLRFDANLPAFPPPLPASASTLLADRGDYPEGTYRDLRDAAASYAGCAVDEVVIDAGADGLIGLVARTFLAAGRRAVVEDPTYPLYSIASGIEGATVAAASANVDALVAAGRGAHVLWLCNPANPSGALRPLGEIADLAAVLPETLVCVDEAYYEYAGESVAALAATRPNLVCIRTLSKAFGLGGLRVGYAIAALPVAAELTARREPAPVSTVAARIAAAALRDPVAAAAEVEAVRAERERIRGALAAAGYDVPAVHANFVVVRMPDALSLATRLERRGLVVRAYPGALRLTVRSPADDDLLLAALGLEAPRATRRSATVLGPGTRASLVADGAGRVRVQTGDADRDGRLERMAVEAGLDLELLADGRPPNATVADVLGEALAQAIGSDARAFS